MLTIDEQIAEIEEVLRKTPHHKATNGFIGAMRAKIAHLRDREVENIAKSHSAGGKGFFVKKQGDATAVLVGPPSAGKSTLINKLTNAESKVAPYSFTTVTVVPGMLKYNSAYIQLLDIPGLIEGASRGRGRGREVLSVARSADLLIIMTDTERVEMIDKMVEELKAFGIRLNTVKPEISIKKSADGGLEIKSNFNQEIDKNTIKKIAHEYGIKNGTITLKQKVSLNDLFDAFSENRIYVPAILIVNKCDQGKVPDKYLAISAQKDIGINNLLSQIWESLNFVAVQLTDGTIIMKAHDTLFDVVQKIGSDFSDKTKAAKIWGSGAKFPGQEVSLGTEVEEGMKVKFI